MATKKPAAASSEQVEARVLVACHFGKPNDVVTVTAEQAEAGISSGVIDTAADAVAYAKSLAGN